MRMVLVERARRENPIQIGAPDPPLATDLGPGHRTVSQQPTHRPAMHPEIGRGLI
jgi:hypothetical protein